jgi:hypothetical protein
MANIEIDDDRVEKLPLWAGELIYRLDNARKGADQRIGRLQEQLDEARTALLDYTNGNAGPDGSDTFVARDQVDDPMDDRIVPDLGLGRGVSISFGAPHDYDGTAAPSIQARMHGGRLLLTSEFGDLSLTVTSHTPTGRAGVAVTISER